MKLTRTFSWSLSVLLLAAQAVCGQTIGSLAARVYLDAQGNALSYRLWVPPNYVAAVSYPLVLSLHGSGGLNLSDAPIFLSAQNQLAHPCLLVAPVCPTNSAWDTGNIQNLVKGLLDQLQGEFNVDPDRIYLTGVSLGSIGAWSMVASFPRTFAAVVGMCGYASIPSWTAYTRPAVWYFHAQDDLTIDIAGARAMIKAMRQAGGTPIYTEYASGGHGIWTQAYATPPLVDWVMAQRLGQPSSLPPRVTLLTPAGPAPVATAADILALTGVATNLGTNIIRVTWTNSLGGGGRAAGTTAWSIPALPLKLGTNTLTILAAGPTWSNLGGSTTFNTGLTVVRAPPIVASIAINGRNTTLSWTGGVPPFQIETSSTLAPQDWVPLLTNDVRTATLPINSSPAYFRISGQ